MRDLCDAPRSVVYAVDALSGKVLWTFAPKMEVGMDNAGGTGLSDQSRLCGSGRGKCTSARDCRLVAMTHWSPLRSSRHFERADSNLRDRQARSKSADLLSVSGVESRDRSSHSRVAP